MSTKIKSALLEGGLAVYCIGLAVFLLSASSWDKEFAIRNMSTIALIALLSILAAALVSAMRGRATLARSQRFWLFAFVLSLLVSVRVTQFSFSELFDQQGTAGAARLFSGLSHVNMSLLPEALAEIFETIFVAFLATAIAIPAAFILAFFCAKNIMMSKPAFAVYATLRTLLNLTRSVEPLIWVVIFSVWVGIGPFAGMLALMVHSVASLAKQYSEIMESVDSGPIDGVRATGANRAQVIWFGIIPQVILPYIAFTFYRWDINVRMATVIGLAGGGGIGTLLLKYQGQAMWPEVGCIIFVVAGAVWAMDAASAYVRETLR